MVKLTDVGISFLEPGSLWILDERLHPGPLNTFTHVIENVALDYDYAKKSLMTNIPFMILEIKLGVTPFGTKAFWLKFVQKDNIAWFYLIIEEFKIESLWFERWENK